MNFDTNSGPPGGHGKSFSTVVLGDSAATGFGFARYAALTVAMAHDTLER
jgi:hypothetical protein